MDPGHQDVKLPAKDRKRISYGSQESDDKKRVVKPKYDVDERILDCIICKNQLSPPVCQVILFHYCTLFSLFLVSCDSKC